MRHRNVAGGRVVNNNDVADKASALSEFLFQ